MPATIVNWGGDQQVGARGLGARARPARRAARRTFVDHPTAIGGVTIDNTRRLELLGPTRVDWHDGFRRMVANLHPEALVADLRLTGPPSAALPHELTPRSTRNAGLPTEHSPSGGSGGGGEGHREVLDAVDEVGAQAVGRADGVDVGEAAEQLLGT